MALMAYTLYFLPHIIGFLIGKRRKKKLERKRSLTDNPKAYTRLIGRPKTCTKMRAKTKTYQPTKLAKEYTKDILQKKNPH